MSDEDIKAGMRRLLSEQGAKVVFTDRWGTKEPDVYGWHDWDSRRHIKPYGHNASDKPCRWVIPSGTVVKEETYSQFDGTFTNNKDEVGLNADGVSCACGKYTDVTIRVTMSLGEAIRHLVGYDTSKEMKL